MSYYNANLSNVIFNLNSLDSLLTIAYISDVEFLLKHYKLKKEDEEEDVTNPQEESEEEWIQCQKDALDISNDFVRFNDNCMEIARYYGVREFLVLIPARKASLTDETRIKILLSSLTIATNNANW